ncbi:ABC transporter substrate-binding protein [Pseudoroseicyclus aestuarii]|uniref:Amino acid/amide ABC transporter substrate-binding protein (HAAT family) n=1 Tax=Pseudoroseicyclus aestuarii TaxID=1795041 RepID=A0A318TCT7_9RHOB|nr:ABC transporter substrate-binding protein [Pseudoroseicyclus aestuarii]PYE86118.1 amino acid/amide ABC transporter substrate-binding protein (HAAT family) [Pseudoroseicyclus aestuarii]
MRKLLTATATLALTAGAAGAQEDPVRIGILLGFTGPLESLAPDMAAGAELAIAEVNEAGGILDGRMVEGVRADDTCIDSAAATSAAERLVNDGVAGIIGGDCSGVTGAVLQNVARPNGLAMISPSATSPALSTAEDDDLFFRTAPSDARQGQIMSDILMERGIQEVAVTYTNNDYGQGLADAFVSSFEEAGGTVTINASHEDGKADYSSEVAALASGGGEMLVVAGYLDQGGKGIIQSSLDTGAFDAFYLPDGMVGQAIVDELGDDLQYSVGDYPGTDSEGAELFQTMASEGDFDGTSAFSGESYDAAALMMLAMAKAGSTDSADYAPMVMDIANGPGTEVFPGDLASALEMIANGEEIDYVGATAVELIEPGESAGNYREVEFTDGDIVTVNFR